jgi:hypothetical protein
VLIKKYLNEAEEDKEKYFTLEDDSGEDKEKISKEITDKDFDPELEDKEDILGKSNLFDRIEKRVKSKAPAVKAKFYKKVALELIDLISSMPNGKSKIRKWLRDFYARF